MSQLDDLLDGLDVRTEQTDGISFSVVGDAEDRRKVIGKLLEAGANLTHSGPYTDAEISPDVDASRFLFCGFLPKQDDPELLRDGRQFEVPEDSWYGG